MVSEVTYPGQTEIAGLQIQITIDMLTFVLLKDSGIFTFTSGNITIISD